MEELDLKELFNMFWVRKSQIIAVTLLAIVLGAMYTYLYVEPVYLSYTTLVLATSESSSSKTSETITATDITINNNLVSTYSELIKSKKILRQVIENLQINKTEEELKKEVSVSSVKNTQLIQINVIDRDSQTAKKVADEIAKVFSEEVTQIYKINNVHIVDIAEKADVPYNTNHIKDLAIFGFVGLVLACGYVLIANMLDTTVKNKDDLEKKLGIPVLVTIPVADFEETSKKKRKGGK